MSKAWNFKDLTGQKFGRLTVVKRGENTADNKARWWCQCDCGNPELVLVIGKYLRKGASQSCGCYKKERNSLVHKKFNLYDLSGDYGIGYTYNKDPYGRNEFYFDLEDYDKIKDYCWTFKDDYLVATIPGDDIMVQLHRIILNASSDVYVDHIHGNLTRNDNRKSNIRIATPSQNAMNSAIRNDNTSGVTGVYWHKIAGKWCVSIQKDGVRHALGLFENFEDAVRIRKEAEEKYFGEWSYDNSQAM